MAKTNLTLVIDEDLLRRARMRALSEGRSVNEVVRERIAAYAGEQPGRLALAGFLEHATRASRPRPDGPRWTRDELYDRPVLR